MGLEGRTAILVDDGTSGWPVLLAAVRGLRSWGAEEIVLAVPATSRSAVLMLINEVDDLYCPSVHKEREEDGRAIWGRAAVSDAEAYALWAADQPKAEY
jgi:predicted phosphoribosyltransferase